MKKYVIGIDIGGTKCAVILGSTTCEHENKSFEILDRICFHTKDFSGPAKLIEKMTEVIHKLILQKELSQEEILGIGISCGGPLDHVEGVIKNPPNLYGWDNIPIVKIMEDEFHIPTYIQNDANACALAEWKMGAAQGYQNVIFLTYGTGMGAGLILNGQLYNGTDDMAGEIGHVRMTEIGPVGYGKAGSFEGFCSGGGIAQIAKMKVLEKLQRGEKPLLCPSMDQLESLTARTVAEAAVKGDDLALEIYKTSGYYLGRGLSVLIDILNPEVIVIGSIYERSSELLSDTMFQVIEKEALEISRKSCRILPAKLGNSIGDYAALSVALQGGSGQ